MRHQLQWVEEHCHNTECLLSTIRSLLPVYNMVLFEVLHCALVRGLQGTRLPMISDAALLQGSN